MKVYFTLLVTTLFLSFYSWVWEKYLYDRLYARYLPNYYVDGPCPTYNVVNGELQKNTVEIDWYTDVPYYAKIMYYAAVPVIMFTYCLYIITFLLGCVIVIKKKMYFQWKWLISNLIIFTIILIFIKNTPIMD